MQKLFADKVRAFWVFQTGGWLGYGIIRTFNGLALGQTASYVKPSIVAMLAGFGLTLVMRLLYRSVRDKSLTVIVTVGLTASALMSLAFSTVETIGHITFYNPFWDPRALEFFGNAAMDFYVLLTWTGLYFLINYYLVLQKEKEKALKAVAMAHQAQLKMLRYQLNPHFLFNTLNAVSTLVLEKNSEAANGMLRKLSSFLRYTLVNQPTQKVSLSQEMHALKLYLDIEKVRFQDRLQIEWDMEKDALEAMIPSMLIQPLIENALKYAIAPSEEGGCITISAKLEGNRLIMRVRDDGPGLEEGVKRNPESSSGVGLTNTRERLLQIYGDDHAFFLHNIEPHGLEAAISIPCEFAERKEKLVIEVEKPLAIESNQTEEGK
ncbi:MAG: histidine kinase [Sphingomonadales bacterium]